MYPTLRRRGLVATMNNQRAISNRYGGCGDYGARHLVTTTSVRQIFIKPSGCRVFFFFP